MKNIIWQMGNGRLAYFSYLDDVDTQALAAAIKAANGVDEDWAAVAFDKVLPTGHQEAWRIVDGEIQVDPSLVSTGPPFAELKAAEVASYIDTREKMCARVAGIGQRLGRAGDTAGALSCDSVVNALLDVLAHPTVTGAADIDSLRVALKTRYLAAVSLASASARTEFKRYDK